MGLGILYGLTSRYSPCLLLSLSSIEGGNPPKIPGNPPGLGIGNGRPPPIPGKGLGIGNGEGS